jgi:hypothetical protein
MFNDWMGRLYAASAHFRTRRLDEIVIPGTHDSGCYGTTSEPLASPFSNTQEADITTQLNRGIRYFDLRFKNAQGARSSFLIYHSFIHYPSSTLTSFLASIVNFLQENPSEILILNVKQLAVEEKDDFLIFFNQLHEALKTYMAERKLRDQDTRTIHDMITRNERIILSVYLEKEYRHILERLPYREQLWDNIFSPYDEDLYKTHDLPAIKERMEFWFNEEQRRAAFDRSPEEKHKSRLWVTQGVLTGAGLSRTIKPLADKINPTLNTWLMSGEWRNRPNIVITDYFLDSFVETAIALNTQAPYKFAHKDTNNFQLKNFETASTPFVYKDHVYFQGTDNKLWKVDRLGEKFCWLGNQWTNSAPFVYDDYVYFQGTDNRLLKIEVDRDTPGGEKHIGNAYTISRPFVLDDEVYYQDGKNRLCKVNIHGTDSLGFEQWTKTTPFVFKSNIYFQGTDDRLLKIDKNSPKAKEEWLGSGNKMHTKSTPWVEGGFIYYQNQSDKIRKMGVIDQEYYPLPDQSIYSEPCLDNDYLYFRGEDQKLLKMHIEGTHPAEQISKFTTSSRPFVYSNYIYFQGTDNKLWVHKLSGTDTQYINLAFLSTPCIDDEGFMYFQGADHSLWKVKRDGEVMWTQLDYGIQSAPVIDDQYVHIQGRNVRDNEHVYFRGRNNALMKVRRSDGALIAEYGFNLKSAPFMYKGFIFFQNGADKLEKFNVRDETSAPISLHQHIVTAPFVYQDYIYFGGKAPDLWGNLAHQGILTKVHVDDLNNKEAVILGVEDHKGTLYTISAPYVHDGYIYYQGRQDQLCRVRTDGKESHIYNQLTKSTPCVYKDDVYFQGTDDRLLKMNITNNEIWGCIGGYKTQSNPIVYTDGTIHFINEEKKLVSILKQIPFCGVEAADMSRVKDEL